MHYNNFIKRIFIGFDFFFKNFMNIVSQLLVEKMFFFFKIQIWIFIYLKGGVNGLQNWFENLGCKAFLNNFRKFLRNKFPHTIYFVSLCNSTL